VRTRSIKRKLKTVTALPENASSDMLELTGFGDFEAVDEE
jgi:hypothetical protein